VVHGHPLGSLGQAQNRLQVCEKSASLSQLVNGVGG
jgi:hypothetical protein